MDKLSTYVMDKPPIYVTDKPADYVPDKLSAYVPRFMRGIYIVLDNVATVHRWWISNLINR